MNSILHAGLVLGLLTSCVLANPLKFQAKCVPGDNCKAPDCRCWDDADLPGNITVGEIPMMILLSFDYSMNAHTVKNYLSILESLTNPNGCRSKGTFFIQALNSEAATLKQLYDDKNELALNSARGIIPTDEAKWEESFQEIFDLLDTAKVPMDAVKGVRAPQLFEGGDDQFMAMSKMGLKYDASCVTVKHSTAKELLWPYTTDFTTDIPTCNIGHTPRDSYPGIWEFPVPTLKFKDRHCPTPSGCIPEINSTNDVFRLFFDAFDNHYYNNRAPFVIDIDAYWVTEPIRLEGTLQFLELVGAYADTWILTMSQALEWIQNPLSMDDILAKGYKAWDCPASQKVRK